MNRISRKISDMVRLACWRTLNPAITRESGVTLHVRSDSDWEVLQEVFINHDYDEAISSALNSSKLGQEIQIIDLGANVGFFMLRCIDLYRQAQLPTPLKILSVEGAPQAFAELQRRAGALSKGNVTLDIRQGLVGRRTGKAKIYSSPFSSMTNSVVRGNGRTSRIPLLGRHAEDSEYIDLLTLIPETGTIDLLKCDIEGSELEFLQNYGDLLSRTRLLVIELHPKECDADACAELLRKSGFTLLRNVFVHPTHILRIYKGPDGNA